MTFLRLELWRAAKDVTFGISLLLLVACSSFALLYGMNQSERQNEVIDRLDQLVRESDELYFEARFKDDENIGRVHYYLRQATAHRPRPEAALSLGQRDLHSYHQSVSLRSLYTNLFDAGFENPSRSEAGHFDLAFVIVFLLPLVVIASTHDILAREIEGRTLRLLLASGCSLPKLLLSKLGARFIVTSAALFLVVSISLLLTGAHIQAFLAWNIVVLGYNLFWFSISGLIVSLAFGAARSAGLLLTVWTILTIVFPALLNLMLPREATQSGAALTIQCRQVVNQAWDSDKNATKLSAQKRFAEYSKAPVEGEKFTWSWYYAMHDSGDQAVEELASNYLQGLAQKDQKTYAFSLLAPPVRTQLLLDRLAGTDLSSQLQYFKHVMATREGMQSSSLPRVFREEKLSKDSLYKLHDSLALSEFVPATEGESTRGMIELWIVSLLLALFCGKSLNLVEKRIKVNQ